MSNGRSCQYLSDTKYARIQNVELVQISQPQFRQTVVTSWRNSPFSEFDSQHWLM
jgi:hypothetical protein